MNNIIMGEYVIFGVFKLYNDPCFDNTIKTLFTLIFSIPFEILNEYPKTAKLYFQFIDLLFHNNFDAFLTLDEQSFAKVLENLQEGIKSYDISIVTASCSSLNNFSTYYYQNKYKNTPNMLFFRRIIDLKSSAWDTLLLSLLFLFIYDNDVKKQWQLSRPMFPILLIKEDALTNCCNQLKINQTPLNQIKLEDAFKRLTEGLDFKLDPCVREGFTNRATQIRSEIRTFLQISNI